MPSSTGNSNGRSEAARIAVLEAADDLLAERGLAWVTIEGIAARAQVAKQTIYRWWNSKTDILFDALVDDADEHFTTPDHGDLAHDLRGRSAHVTARRSTGPGTGATCPPAPTSSWRPTSWSARSTTGCLSAGSRCRRSSPTSW
jgi:AcrR family transcriptional regulator